MPRVFILSALALVFSIGLVLAEAHEAGTITAENPVISKIACWLSLGQHASY
ncbi:MAG: hypothetical protein AAFR44_03105 [Pseudomonadota bacterium]